MATTYTPWTIGDGTIILTYTGQGNGTITVSSTTDNNSSEARSQVITVSGGGITRQVTITQEGKSYSQQYLTFIPKVSGTFKLTQNAVDYSLDGGSTWTTLAANTDSPTVSAGSKIMWRGNLTPVTSNGVGRFYSSGWFDVEGNVMSLLFGDNFSNQLSLYGKSYAFMSLFYQCNVVNAENLVLPATTLSGHCYMAMFASCANLEKTPKVLPATTCTSSCYRNMFGGCSKITSGPTISATTLAANCCAYMFNECRALSWAPALPATTLASNCYGYMFQYCTSLFFSPILPATTLVNKCYEGMFQNCIHLGTVAALFTTTPSGAYTSKWLDNVASDGTFLKNPNATWSVSGANGVPSGWTIVDYEV